LVEPHERMGAEVGQDRGQRRDLLAQVGDDRR
jgi:hypothetical protein